MKYLTSRVKFAIMVVMNKMLWRDGQIGLLLLVVMALILSLAMSLGARSLSDSVMSRQESGSAKAFRLAENGVEQAMNMIRQGNTSQGTTTQNEGIFAGAFELNPQNDLSLYVKEGEQVYIDLETFDANNDLLIRWSRVGDLKENPGCTGEGSGLSAAAMEIIQVSGDGNTASFDYYNPANCPIVANGFASSSMGNEEYVSQVDFNVTTGSREIKLRPIYGGATINVTANGLGVQLYQIQSYAEGGDAKKEIMVKRGLDAPPSIFDFALFSGTTIVK